MRTAISLDLVAAQVQEAQDAAGFAWQLSQRYFHATTDDARSELVTKAGQEARKALDASRDALEALQDAGAVLADRVAKPASNPLAELARVENSRGEALALLDALCHALPLADALDQKRGDTGGDWEERIAELQSALKLELFGPGDRVTGGRE